MSRHYIDCEFDGHNGPLISFAMVSPDDEEEGLYLIHNVSSEEYEGHSQWVKDNVWSVIDKCPDDFTVDFLEDVHEFGTWVRNCIADGDTIIADSPVDIGRFCQIISTDKNGDWHNNIFSNLKFEVHNVDCYPTDLPGAIQHNAAWDALALQHRLFKRKRK